MNAIKEALAEILGLFIDDSVLAIGLVVLMAGCFIGAQRHLLDNTAAMVVLAGGAVLILVVDLYVEFRKRSRAARSA